MATRTYNRVTNKLLGDKTAIRNYQELLVNEDLHPGEFIPNAGELRHNLTANRDPLPSDDFSYGFREGSNWFNQLTKKLFICLESHKEKTTWVDVKPNLDNLFSRVTNLIPVQVENDEYFIQLPLDTDLEIKKIFSVYILDTVKILAGWIIDERRVYFPKNQFTSFMEGKFAIVSFAEGADYAEHIM